APPVQIAPPLRPQEDGAAAVTDRFGNRFVIWSEAQPGGLDTDVFGRFFDRAWRPLSERFQVNTWTPNLQTELALAVLGNGDFAALWGSGEELRPLYSGGSSQDGS